MKKVSLKIWIMGFVWFVGSCMGPFVTFIYDWHSRWDDPLDWTMLWHQFAACGATGAYMYWRKYKALIQLPPDLQMAREMASQVRTTTETDQSGTVTKTVEETHTAKETVVSPADLPKP